MPNDIVANFAFALMIGATVLGILLAQRSHRALRLSVNTFAFAFANIGNYLAPKPLSTLPEGDALLALQARAGNDRVVALYQELCAALDVVEKRCGTSRRLKEQFYQPVESIFLTTREFLLYCEQGGPADSPLEPAFRRFLLEQTDLRQQLLRRISGDAGPAFAELNAAYPLVDEMPGK